MSYKENIYTAYAELARIHHSNNPYGVYPRHIKNKHLIKLHMYLKRAGIQSSDYAASPSDIRGGSSRLGKRAKQEALIRNTYDKGKKAPKVFRRTIRGGVFQYRVMTLMNMCAMPQFPADGILTNEFDHVIWVRNKGIGELIFVKADGSSVVVPYAENLDATEPEVSAAWSLLTRIGPKGDQIPLIPARRRSPVSE